MAYFAKMTNDNEVLTVVCVNDSDTTNAEGVIDESVGQQFLERTSNWPAAQWKQTFKDGTRGNFAGIGYTWDENNNVFWGRKPYDSWVKDIATAEWVSPVGNVPALTEEQESQNAAKTHEWYYKWNEESQNWDLTNFKA